VSLAASWLLVSRLERLAERAGFSEAWLGLVAALAADAPEITSAVTALARGQASVGAGVVIGSNVFNLAALLGLAAVVAGRIAFHRKVVLLAGVPGIWVAVVCLLVVAAVLPPAGGLALAAAVLGPVIAVLGMRRTRLERLRLPAAWRRWLIAAVHEEEDELAEAIRPRPGTWRDGLAAVAALAAVVAASTVMELAATALGSRYAVAGIVTGGLVLAVVTSLPNAVSAVYLAVRGRGAAVLSTALSSNAINVVGGLLIPASITGLGPASGQDVPRLVAAGLPAGGLEHRPTVGGQPARLPGDRGLRRGIRAAPDPDRPAGLRAVLRAADRPVAADCRLRWLRGRARDRARRPGPDLRDPRPVRVRRRGRGDRHGFHRGRRGAPAAQSLTSARRLHYGGRHPRRPGTGLDRRRPPRSSGRRPGVPWPGAGQGHSVQQGTSGVPAEPARSSTR
jgi:cation:H+ antiporter